MLAKPVADLVVVLLIMANKQALIIEICQRLKQTLPSAGIQIVAGNDKTNEHSGDMQGGNQQPGYLSDTV